MQQGPTLTSTRSPTHVVFTGTLFRGPRLARADMPARIVDVGHKPLQRRRAQAEGRLRLAAATLDAIREKKVDKGDVQTIAGVAALQAVKRTPEWLPLCHPLPITHVDTAFSVTSEHLVCLVTVETTAQTGVEMEALTGVTAALLCAWDMVKPLEKDEHGQYPGTRIESVRVLLKEKEDTEANA